MPKILPDDPSYRVQSWTLTALSAISVQYFLDGTKFALPDILRITGTLVLPTATFSLLHGRHISLQRVAALCLSHTEPYYRLAMKNKTILTHGGMLTIFQLLASTALLSNLPLLYYRLMHGEVAAWWGMVEKPVAWFFGAVNLTVVVVCWVMVLTQEEMRVEFDSQVSEDDVPLNKLGKAKKKGAKKEEWTKVASTSRRHDVWIKPILLPNGDAVGVFDMATRLAPNHPLYKPDADTKPSGPILRISLP
ncbi:related to cytochrome c oxidase subunit I [Sporisorium reilianum f. sp. reilianum]|uniref:Related to cytochrome c oxidase subunit I n=1 Tax=Sporisorium reilianum f. sp. reilianum TaxID=72559 RepID=A0A2N8UB68_9BASI|nr:related to cytochrome c oxidase subunit I [Sporisorium reilianum f. sp. reilianum]